MAYIKNIHAMTPTLAVLNASLPAGCPTANTPLKLGVAVSADKTHITMECTIREGVSADIYYTNDGSTPTKDSTKYTAKIALPESDTTYKVIAIGEGYITSDVVTFSYTAPKEEKEGDK